MNYILKIFKFVVMYTTLVSKIKSFDTLRPIQLKIVGLQTTAYACEPKLCHAPLN